MPHLLIAGPLYNRWYQEAKLIAEDIVALAEEASNEKDDNQTNLMQTLTVEHKGLLGKQTEKIATSAQLCFIIACRRILTLLVDMII